MLERIERRHREAILLAVIAYNNEAFPLSHIKRRLERLLRLKKKIENGDVKDA